MNSPEIVMIAALGRNRELGRDGNLIWHIPGDLSRFKAMTMGHPLIMGRRTFESIGRPLPGRTNIVISRNTGLQGEGVKLVQTVDAALEIAREEGAERVFIIGGSEIYRLFLPGADRLELTLIHEVAADADVFFPDYSDSGFEEVARTPGTGDGIAYEFVTLERRRFTT